MSQFRKEDHAHDEHAIELLKSYQIRVTPQRVAIMKTLLELDHPTAEQIHGHIGEGYSNMSFATVYNTLRSLKEVGLLHEIHCGNGCTRFEVMDQLHYHLICKQCGRIEDVFFKTDIDFSAVAKLKGYEFQEQNIEIYGLCASCKIGSSAN